MFAQAETMNIQPETLLTIQDHKTLNKEQTDNNSNFVMDQTISFTFTVVIFFCYFPVLLLVFL